MRKLEDKELVHLVDEFASVARKAILVLFRLLPLLGLECLSKQLKFLRT